MPNVHRSMLVILLAYTLTSLVCNAAGRLNSDALTRMGAAVALLSVMVQLGRYYWQVTRFLRLPLGLEKLPTFFPMPMLTLLLRLLILMSVWKAAMGMSTLLQQALLHVPLENPGDIGLDSGLNLLTALAMTFLLEVDPDPAPQPS